MIKMDEGELLSFEPVPTPKRPNEDRSDSDEEPLQAMKMRRLSKQSIGEQGEVLDDAAVKKLVLNFQKKALKNREMKIQFPDQPEKFMDSDLLDALQELSVVLTVPEKYSLLADMRCVNSLLELLSHDNTDISIKAVNLVQELTDVGATHEREDFAGELIHELQAETPALLLRYLSGLNEQVPVERDAMRSALSIVGNILELRPVLITDGPNLGFMEWILKRLKMKAPFDTNTWFATEILSLMLRAPKNQMLIGELGGVEVMLQRLAVYKRHNPAGADEENCMDNLFKFLYYSLIQPGNKDRFLLAGGLQLMTRMLRAKKMSRDDSLNVIDHAMEGTDAKDVCNKFVDIFGLRTLFPLFMRTPKLNRMIPVQRHEAHVLSIIASMLRNCEGRQRKRLLAKFTEKNLEKVDRLLKLRFKYMNKVDKTKKKLKRRADILDGTHHLRLLKGGLRTLQLIEWIIQEVSTIGPIRRRVQRAVGRRQQEQPARHARING